MLLSHWRLKKRTSADGFLYFWKECLWALNYSLKTILNVFFNHVIQVLTYIGEAGNIVCFECQSAS